MTFKVEIEQEEDGRWIAISASTQPMFERLARCIGRED